MKKLRSFLKFDGEEFFKDKTLYVMASEPLKDKDSIVGTKYKCVIMVDDTDYGDDTITNVGESLVIKALDIPAKKIEKPTMCELVDPICSVYGDYMNNLSVTAKDIELIYPTKP